MIGSMFPLKQGTQSKTSNYSTHIEKWIKIWYFSLIHTTWRVLIKVTGMYSHYCSFSHHRFSEIKCSFQNKCNIITDSPACSQPVRDAEWNAYLLCCILSSSGTRKEYRRLLLIFLTICFRLLSVVSGTTSSSPSV